MKQPNIDLKLKSPGSTNKLNTASKLYKAHSSQGNKSYLLAPLDHDTKFVSNYLKEENNEFNYKSMRKPDRNNKGLSPKKTRMTKVNEKTK